MAHPPTGVCRVCFSGGSLFYLCTLYQKMRCPRSFEKKEKRNLDAMFVDLEIPILSTTIKFKIPSQNPSDHHIKQRTAFLHTTES